MIPADIQEIFGTLSVGFAALFAAITLYWITSGTYASFINWIRNHSCIPKAPVLIGVLFIAIFGFGLILQDTTDRLTDSEYRTWSDSPIWPPSLQVRILGQESEHRFRSVFYKPKKKEQESNSLEHGFVLNGLGKQVFANKALCQVTTSRISMNEHHEVYEKQRWTSEFLKNPDHFLEETEKTKEKINQLKKDSLFLNKSSQEQEKIIKQKQKNINQLKRDSLLLTKTTENIKKRKKHTRRVTNLMYYEAKNWAYRQDNHFVELEDIQRRVDFSRSIFLVSSYYLFAAGTVAIIMTFIFIISNLRNYFTTHKVVYFRFLRRWQRLTVSSCIAAFVSFGGWLGYEHAENAFNERTFGYYISGIHEETKTLVQEPQSNRYFDMTLGSVLWLQTSAEYQAICQEIYKSAEDAIRELKKKYDNLKGNNPNLLPPAVIMDLDETVLDNSGYQAELLRRGLKHSSKSWKEWEQEGHNRIGLVPGAKDYIQEVKNQGITVIFLSNRSELERYKTIECLRVLGIRGGLRSIPDDDKEWLLLKDNSSSKESRRLTILQKHTVISIIGDNLADFHEVFEATNNSGNQGISNRKEELRNHLTKRFLINEDIEKYYPQEKEIISEIFGESWFIIPNPVYGDWMKPFGKADPTKFLDLSRQ